MKKENLVILIIIVFGSCQAQEKKEKDLFDYNRLRPLNDLQTHKDSCLFFINKAVDKEFLKCTEVFPDIVNIDVSSGMIHIDGYEPFLSGVGEYIDDYSSDSYKLLVLSVFLREKHNARKTLYDQLLRGSLRLDSTNLDALYLLAKHRYDNGFDRDAHYLVTKMSEVNSDNEEVKKAHLFFKNEYENFESELPSLYIFLRQNIEYYEDN